VGVSVPVSQQAMFAGLNIHVRSNNAEPSASTTARTDRTQDSEENSLQLGSCNRGAEETTSSNFLCKAT